MISAVHPSRPRAIILDLDRTLLHTDKSLSARAIRALLACRAKGIQIMMATARPYRCTLDDCEKIPFDAMTVTNGAIILCEDQRLDFPMSPQAHGPCSPLPGSPLRRPSTLGMIRMISRPFAIAGLAWPWKTPLTMQRPRRIISRKAMMKME